MTMQNDPTLVAPPRFYWYLHLNRARQKKAVKSGNEKAAKRFAKQVAFGVNAIVQKNPDTTVRLWAYREKPAELWVEQMMKFPSGYWWAFKESWDDWVKLSPVDFVRDARVGEILDIMERIESPLQVMDAPPPEELPA